MIKNNIFYKNYYYNSFNTNYSNYITLYKILIIMIILIYHQIKEYNLKKNIIFIMIKINVNQPILIHLQSK